MQPVYDWKIGYQFDLQHRVKDLVPVGRAPLDLVGRCDTAGFLGVSS